MSIFNVLPSRLTPINNKKLQDYFIKIDATLKAPSAERKSLTNNSKRSENIAVRETRHISRTRKSQVKPQTRFVWERMAFPFRDCIRKIEKETTEMPKASSINTTRLECEAYVPEPPRVHLKRNSLKTEWTLSGWED